MLAQATKNADCAYVSPKATQNKLVNVAARRNTSEHSMGSTDLRKMFF